MNDEKSTLPPPRRKRFQFSLRTLMIAIIAYGGAWLLTIKWGANQLAAEMALKDNSLEYRFVTKKLSDGQLELQGRVARHIGNIDPFQLSEIKKTIIVRCPFPFVLLYSEIYEANNRRTQPKNLKRFSWFFGSLASYGDSQFIEEIYNVETEDQFFYPEYYNK